MGLVILILVLGAGYFLFKSAKPSVAPLPTPTIAPTTVQASPTPISSPSATQESTQKITITGNEFAFTPSTITVKKGQVVELTFKNDGKFPHNLTISDLSLATKTIQPGQEDTITFTPSKTGSFSFICTVPGHADRGMRGALIVQ